MPGVQEVRYTHTAPGLSVSSVVWIAGWVQFGGRLWMGALGGREESFPILGYIMPAVSCNVPFLSGSC